jgi:predicted DCC family thiol-disulfide oxidoreductase YuxK
MARPGSLRLINFQEPGILKEFPGIDYETCMRHMLLVTPDGRKFAGAEAIVHALTTRGGFTKLAYLYYVPGIRQLSDLLYWCVARMRYYILGKVDPCKDGTCRI